MRTRENTLVLTRFAGPNFPTMERILLASAVLCLSLITRAAKPELFTEVRIKETAGRNYLCPTKDLKIAELAEFAPTTAKALMAKAKELKLGVGGSMMIIYHNFQGDPEEKFIVEITVPISATEAAETGEFYVQKVPKFKCAATVFQGSMAQRAQACRCSRRSR